MAIAAGVVISPPVTTVVTMGLIIFATGAFIRTRLAGKYLGLLGLGLGGYAFLGRGFAYLGVPPFYVGELLLSLGLVALLIARGLGRAYRSPLFLPLVAVLLLGVASTVPHLQQYGLTALRDAAIWGYAVFAILVAAFTLKAGAVARVLKAYGTGLPWFLLWVPIGWTVYRLAPTLIPKVHGAEVPLLNPKGGDIAVHLAAAMAFMVLNLWTSYSKAPRSYSGREWFWWALWLIGCLLLFTGRAAILTVLSVVLLILVMRPVSRWGRLLFLLVLMSVAFVGTDVRINLGTARSVSSEDIVLTLRSIFGDTGTSAYDGSRRWRLAWWSDIIDYTVFGDYFWTGKGYGINLADADGYQVLADSALRSPHSSHLTFLARGGVPGALAWLALNMTFAILLFRAYFRARRLGQDDWAKVNLWLLAYWLAFMVNATFDVFLEGPQGGIWFWSLFGFGIAVLETQRLGLPLRLSTRST